MPFDSASPSASPDAAAQLAALESALHAATERAAAAERRLAELLEPAEPGRLLLAPTGTIIRVNEALCHLLGSPETPEFWAGQPANALFARLQHLAAQPTQFAQQLRAQRAAQLPVLGEAVPLRDGRVLTQDYLLLPAPSGAARAELFSYRLAPAPGVARPLGAESLAETLQAQLLDNLPLPAATHSMQGVLLACNQAFAQLLQWPAQHLPGGRLSEVLPSADPALPWPAYLAQFATESQAAGQLAVLPRDGQPRQLAYRAQRLEQPGQPPYVLLCALDLTERAQAEAELRRGKELAEASARAKESFLANLSHEIRTPMNGVLGMARQLTKTDLGPDQRELLRIIQASGEHLLSVLNEVLDMTKISAARLEMEQVSFDLRESVEEALQPLVVQAEEKGLAFHLALLQQPEPLPRVIGDAYRLNQVLLNLVSNAIKFTAAPGSIAVGAYVLGETETHLTAGFRITDTGMGIAADKLDLIFEDFVQADTDTTRRFGGTGLGLGIARALVEQMGGTIAVNSQPGSGSTFQFSVTLPRAQGIETAPRPVLADTGALRGRRVLVVEDNGINREVVRRVLHGWGVVVDEAADGPTALALHAERPYDAVLMDIQMPGMSGVEATRQLRLHPEPARAQVPVLALTANAFRADLDRYLKAGINDCLTKPFKEDEFYRKLVALVQAPAPPLYDLEQVHELADGEAEFVERVVRSFLLHVPPVLQQAQAAAAVGQWAQVAKLVHHIKPNLVQFGITGIAAPLQLLMEPPRPGTKTHKAREGAVQQLVSQLTRVLEALPREVES
ncbi:response regulator [Hymenobacter bucti]|uniref:histidine kinase n=1 Tax=Hymenobacter bucti TaxID=1844114 RepID=A0ABW4QRC2_9BACT